MCITKTSILAILAIFFFAGCSHELKNSHVHQSSDSHPGHQGTIEFKPKDWKKGQITWWKDSDGVKPGVAGCHIGVTAEGTPNGRMFGEACLSNTLLVESNPEKDMVHSHKNDIGHPDIFDCNTWCEETQNKPGQCVVAQAPPCSESARCECQN